MTASHISVSKQTALEILKGDDMDDEFDYDNYSDRDLFDAFVGAGYFVDESEIHGDNFVLQTPDNCVDARTVGDVTGWPISLEQYYETIKK